MTFEKLLADLPSLSATQRAEVEKRLALLNSSSRIHKTDMPDHARELYNVLSASLRSHGIQIMPLTALLASKYQKGFIEGSELINTYLQQVFPKLSLAERASIQKLLCSLIVNHLARRQIPITLTTFISHTKIISSLFEQQFPGYIASNLQYMILRTKKNHE